MLKEALSHILVRSSSGPLQHTVDHAAHESPWGTGYWYRLEGGWSDCLQSFLIQMGSESASAKACALFPLLRRLRSPGVTFVWASPKLQVRSLESCGSRLILPGPFCSFLNQQIESNHFLIMAEFEINESLPVAEQDDWRYLWDGRRYQDLKSPDSILDQLERHSQPLPGDLSLVSARDWGRSHFLRAAGKLLREHYVEMDNFRFCLHDDFINWAIETPVCDPDLLLGIAKASGGESEDSQRCLVGVAMAVPLWLHREEIAATCGKPNSAMLDFVCIAKKFRGRRLCPFLYTEIARRCHGRGIHHILCTSGDNLKFPVASSRYHHLLNAEQLQKLVDVGFTSQPRNIQRTKERLRIKPENVAPIPLRLMEESDVTALREAYNVSVTERYKLGLLFASDQEFSHALMPRRNIIETLVVDGTTDFISFYTNETEILSGSRRGESIRQAYVYYSCCKNTPRKDLLLAAIYFILQKYQREDEHPIDTVNCLGGIMGNTVAMLEDAGFGPGTGILKYYQFNAPPGSLACEEIAWYTL